MKVSLSCLIAGLVFCCITIALAKQEHTLNKELTKEEISKFSLKNMKRILKDKGVECKECEEKEHFADKVFESQKLPVLNKKSNTKKAKSPQDEANIAEVATITSQHS